jgi:hypothetical protein
MDAMQEMLAEHACERLVHSYANWLDVYDYDRFMTLWTDDAQWVIYGNEMRGLAQIRATLAGRPKDMAIRHVTTNVVIDVTGPDRAQGQCYATAYRALGCLETRPAPLTLPRFLVDYRDWFERDPVRGWFFSRREIVSIMEPIEPTAAAV